MQTKLELADLIDIELGKALNKVEDLRLIADYIRDGVRKELPPNRNYKR
ncbi:MAG: hypothetical protein ACKO4M_11155 [Betaproteobacteria bacterium]